MADENGTPMILRPLAAQLRPVLAAMIPSTSGLDRKGVEDLLARVDARLAMEDPALGRQLRLFVRVLWWLPIFGSLRTLGGLSPARREAFLLGIQDGPVQILRVGLWGLRTLLYLGWYGDAAVQAALGYRPDPRGWEAIGSRPSLGEDTP